LNGSIKSYKACLVAKSYTQIEVIDYLDAFSPVAKLTLVRLLLTFAATQQLHLHEWDVDNAFLYGLIEEAYMVPPPALILPQSNQDCKLTKFLYGLKQVNKQWFVKLSFFLISIGFI